MIRIFSMSISINYNIQKHKEVLVSAAHVLIFKKKCVRKISPSKLSKCDPSSDLQEAAYHCGPVYSSPLCTSLPMSPWCQHPGLLPGPRTCLFFIPGALYLLICFLEIP